MAKLHIFQIFLFHFLLEILISEKKKFLKINKNESFNSLNAMLPWNYSAKVISLFFISLKFI